MSSTFLQPPCTHNSEGSVRRVGFELEYAGVDLETSVRFMSELLDCEAQQTAPFRHEFRHDLGNFKVEVDAALLQKTGYRESLAALGIEINEEWQNNIDDMLESLASVIVPYEIVTPPLPINDMALVEEIVERLREHKARGTGQSLLYAFGVHINAEAAAMDADYLLRHMQAFSLLYDWICEKSAVDFTRRLGPHIKPYPTAYLDLIVSLDYRPTLATLIDDYMQGVGSRNHALDMLPLLAHLDQDRVMQAAKEPDLVKPRPAFHYRLANCQVDLKDWQVASEWRYWVCIEQLANDREMLAGLIADYRARTQSSVFRPLSGWVEHVDQVMS